MSEHENNDCLFCFAYVQLLLILLSYSIATHEILFFQKQWNTFYKKSHEIVAKILFWNITLILRKIFCKTLNTFFSHLKFLFSSCMP